MYMIDNVIKFNKADTVEQFESIKSDIIINYKYFARNNFSKTTFLESTL